MESTNEQDYRVYLERIINNRFLENSEIVEVEIRPFNTIDEQFAFDYGEGERLLTWWRDAMWEYYSTECRALGQEPSEDMPLVCLRFRLLYPVNTSSEPNS